MKTKFFQNCLGVFQGGGCRGAAYVGAYKQSIELGISFSELVGASTGSIIAVFIGAGASPKQLEKIIKELTPLGYESIGLEDPDIWVDKQNDLIHL